LTTVFEGFAGREKRRAIEEELGERERAGRGVGGWEEVGLAEEGVLRGFFCGQI
jgi:hypothetical protein